MCLIIGAGRKGISDESGTFFLLKVGKNLKLLCYDVSVPMSQVLRQIAYN